MIRNLGCMYKIILRMKKFILVALLAFAILECSVIIFGSLAKPKKSDCILVLGCSVYGETPSPFLTARLNQALKLYNDGFGDYIIVSGGKGSGEYISEAEAMKRFLIEQGVPKSKVIHEDQSFSTMQNIKNSKAIMEQRGFNSAIIVSNKFHLLRAAYTAHRLNVKASFSGVFVTEHISHEIFGYIREVPAFIKSLIDLY